MTTKNILKRSDDFIGNHRFTIILMMLILIAGMLTGSWATTSGIEQGYWMKSGYYYMLPENNIFTLGIEIDSIDCSGMAFKSDRYFNDININQTNYGVEVNLNGNRVGGCILK